MSKIEYNYDINYSRRKLLKQGRNFEDTHMPKNISESCSAGGLSI